MSEVTHRTIETNGICMHIAEQGEGPLVLLCHGFPESWYSWRNQLRALANKTATPLLLIFLRASLSKPKTASRRLRADDNDRRRAPFLAAW
jgi:pimeloyl-ACP methyl ester carboxylesterase